MKKIENCRNKNCVEYSHISHDCMKSEEWKIRLCPIYHQWNSDTVNKLTGEEKMDNSKKCPICLGLGQIQHIGERTAKPCSTCNGSGKLTGDGKLIPGTSANLSDYGVTTTAKADGSGVKGCPKCGQPWDNHDYEKCVKGLCGKKDKTRVYEPYAPKSDGLEEVIYNLERKLCAAEKCEPTCPGYKSECGVRARTKEKLSAIRKFIKEEAPEERTMHKALMTERNVGNETAIYNRAWNAYRKELFTRLGIEA